MSRIEDTFAFQLTAAGINHVREYQAIPGRRFRWDFALVHDDIPHTLIEIHGGIWMAKGAHNTGGAIRRDCEKGNLAALHGFRCFSFTTDMVEDGSALGMILEATNGKM